MKPEVLNWLSSMLTEDDLHLLLSMKAKPPVQPIIPSASFIRVPDVIHEYSTMPIGNQTGEGYLFGRTDGYLGLFDRSGKLHNKWLTEVSGDIKTNVEPRWLKGEHANKFVYIANKEELRIFDCLTYRPQTIKTFTHAITGKGESDSPDGRHLILAYGTRIFIYDFLADRVRLEFDLPAGLPLDALYLTPELDAVVNCKDRGTWVWDKSENGLRKVAASGQHQDVMNHLGDDIVVRANDETCTIEWIRLGDKTPQPKTIWAYGWHPEGGEKSAAFHISAPNNDDGKRPWVLVTAYSPNFTNDPDPKANTIAKVMLDGSGAQILTKHNARRGDPYYWMPRASVGPDDSYVFGANGDVFIGRI